MRVFKSSFHSTFSQLIRFAVDLFQQLPRLKRVNRMSMEVEKPGFVFSKLKIKLFDNFE